LPTRWRHKHGSYYFRVPPGLEHRWDGKKEFRLGATLPEAYRMWAARIEQTNEIWSMKQLFDRYQGEVVPTKASKTQESNLISLRRLRPVFGDMAIADIESRHAYKYMDKVTRKHGPHSANRDYEVLSHALTKAVKWGIIGRHPTKGLVEKNHVTPRQRYLSDDELLTALDVAGPVLKAYITLKYITGLRRGDLLTLQMNNITEDGLALRISKTGVGLLIEWTDELRAALSAAIDARPKKPTNLIFCTRNGECYVTPNGRADSFDSLWGRFMKKLKKTHPEVESFQEKDIRKKTANDLDIVLASKLLAHTSEAVTRRHYIVTSEKTSPHSMARIQRHDPAVAPLRPEEILMLRTDKE